MTGGISGGDHRQIMDRVPEGTFLFGSSRSIRGLIVPQNCFFKLSKFKFENLNYQQSAVRRYATTSDAELIVWDTLLQVQVKN